MASWAGRLGGMADSVIDALRRAVQAAPDDTALRLHLAEMELADGQTAAAIASIGPVLAAQPDNQAALELVRRAVTAPAGGAPAAAPPDNETYDWKAAEEALGSDVPPPFVMETTATGQAGLVYSSERSSIKLSDVGGMDNVKQRLNVSFLLPLQNPGLRQLYGKSLRGGLLMYGPPGCGKTYIARAVAGELGAAFLSVSAADVLDRYLGVSERNLHALFQQARRDAPCVLFLDELDTLGQRRTTDGSAMRNVVNGLLEELDGVGTVNDGVFVLAATNQPWQVDPALRRPGRFDRTVLVLPPDKVAREAIFHHYLANRPVEGVVLSTLADRSDGLTGADIAYVCELAAETAMVDSATTGVIRLITMADLLGALATVHPSIGGWLESARNVVMFGEDDGTFAELRAYLKKIKRL